MQPLEGELLNKPFRRTAAVLAIIIVFAGLLFATDKKKSSHPDNSHPTPVSKYTTMPSGVEFYDIVDGTGREAVMGNTVVVNYTGWLINGKKFDSSYDRGQPFSFRIGTGVIRGWTEGVQGMRAGGKRQLRIPPDLAYGRNGQPPMIPPNATLIFDIELLEVR
jgi:FKBP-type peptidyl-prolyl cis-trans isomerase